MSKEMAMLKVLIVDDQPAVRTALETLFEVHSLPVVAVSTPEEALSLIATEDIGAVVQDMNFTQQETSGAEGTRLFRTIRDLDPDMPVLLMTAWSSIERAVELTKEGAADYMAKPWDNDKLVRTVQNLVEFLSRRSPRHAEAFSEAKVFGAAVDQQVVQLDASIAGAREVAFFPPFTGG